MKYKAILFDVGDTLIRYIPASAELYQARLHEIGITITDKDARRIEQTVELCTAEQIYREIHGAPRMDDADFQKMMDTVILSDSAVCCVTEEQKKRFSDTWSLMRQEKVVAEGVFPLLEQLKKTYRLGIISNYRASLAEYLEEVGLRPYFETIIISEIVGYEKPDVRIFNVALQEMDLQPEECLYVGDHPFDVLGAKDAGMDAAWLKTHIESMPEYIKQKPDYVLTDLNALPEILHGT
ncbi:MAG: HAD family hydrolase [Clostridia bacterium]|nr:HAD family hydrolase [Clostridia bacterium]